MTLANHKTRGRLPIPNPTANLILVRLMRSHPSKRMKKTSVSKEIYKFLSQYGDWCPSGHLEEQNFLNATGSTITRKARLLESNKWIAVRYVNGCAEYRALKTEAERDAYEPQIALSDDIKFGHIKNLPSLVNDHSDIANYSTIRSILIDTPHTSASPELIASRVRGEEDEDVETIKEAPKVRYEPILDEKGRTIAMKAIQI